MIVPAAVRTSSSGRHAFDCRGEHLGLWRVLLSVRGLTRETSHIRRLLGCRRAGNDRAGVRGAVRADRAGPPAAGRGTRARSGGPAPPLRVRRCGGCRGGTGADRLRKARLDADPALQGLGLRFLSRHPLPARGRSVGRDPGLGPRPARARHAVFRAGETEPGRERGGAAAALRSRGLHLRSDLVPGRFRAAAARRHGLVGVPPARAAEPARHPGRAGRVPGGQLLPRPGSRQRLWRVVPRARARHRQRRGRRVPDLPRILDRKAEPRRGQRDDLGAAGQRVDHRRLSVHDHAGRKHPRPHPRGAVPPA